LAQVAVLWMLLSGTGELYQDDYKKGQGLYVIYPVAFSILGISAKFL
jgi:hypothetical protein